MENYVEIKKFKNGYGIKNLEINLLNKRLKNVSIYASNGTFKTSFSKTLYDMDNNPNQIRDRLTNEMYESEINIGMSNFENKENPVIVFSREILSQKLLTNLGDKLIRLTVNDESVRKILETENKVDIIYNEIHNLLMVNKINEKNSSLYFLNPIESKLQFLIEIFTAFRDTEILLNIDEIEIKDLNGKVWENFDNKDFISQLSLFNQYLNDKLKSTFFDDSLNDITINTFINSLESTSFINETKGRYIVVNNIEYKSLENFKKMVQDEIKKICSEKGILEKLQFIEKSLGVTKQAGKIKEHIRTNENLRTLYSHGRKKMVISKLKKGCHLPIDETLDFLKEVEITMINLIKEANELKSQFDYAIEIFQRRFKSAFNIKIENKGIAAIGKELPQVVFVHKRKEDLKLSEVDMQDILSSGELTALNIIKFIVEYENSKLKSPIVILDDIVETFDYANRYAFIRYIQDMIIDGANIILLTHNYEFYRTVNSRANLRGLVATTNTKFKVTIEENAKINFSSSQFSNINNIQHLIFSLSFAREIMGYTGVNTDKCLPFLHYNKHTNEKTINELEIIVKDVFPNINLCQKTKEKLYLDSLIELANEKIKKRPNSFDLSSKMIFAIVIRLMVEKKIIGENFALLEEILRNQTRELLDNNKRKFNAEFIKIVEEVLVVTPEFIHTNAFMYEPLIDVSIDDLISLYTRIKEWDDDMIWILEN